MTNEYDYDTYLDKLVEQQTDGVTCPHCDGNGCADGDECFLCEGMGNVSPLLERQYIKEKKEKHEGE